MNAPLPEALRRTLAEADLEHKYTLAQGRAYMSGVQALVRLPMQQHVRDARQGKNTAGFISGYRGSPLGGYDQALWQAQRHLQRHQVVFQPGVNEELAATAVWGTQQLGFAPPGSQRHDGVFGLWYGKGPGVDRCADVFKHANMAGTTPWGGVIAVAGDDHVAKSSTAAHQSDHIFKACGLPVFFPANVQEILDLGLHAWAMSRFAGVWAGLKTIQEIVESSTTVEIDPERLRCLQPDFELPPGGLHIRWPDGALEQEARLMDYKWYAALAYVRANRLNYNAIEGAHDRYGIIASGKAYNDTRQALRDLGLDDAACRALGIRLHKVGVVWPLEAQTTRAFATGLREILVVEEKRQVIEYQLKEELYNWRADVRPDVLGKFDEVGADHSGGEWSMPNPSANQLLRANADLTPELIARALARRLARHGLLPAGSAAAQSVQAHLERLDAQARQVQALRIDTQALQRPPWFCSGCPHNTSTRVPQGSRALGGIGCHYMAIWMDRSTLGFTQMGGEGVPWVGQQPFSHETHVFANLGDGTYFHSGLLAIRQCVAAGVNITFKLLYNDAVAMTGGQPVGERPEGHHVLQIVHSLRAEGVSRLTIVSDAPDKYRAALHTTVGGSTLRLPAGVAVAHRDELDRIQRELRQLPGTTVILYDQTCATEKRRRRKRGQLAAAPRQVLIQPEVCEGCGDCGVQSNCLSIEPLETEFGRKRRINHSSCTQDYSCIEGFCPSFVTLEGRPRARKAVAPALALGASSAPGGAALGEPPEPLLPRCASAPGAVYGVVVAGVGGTGVVTIGQLLGVAAHLEGKAVVTQDAAGLAQKGGATWSHVLLAEPGAEICTTRVGSAAADLILACDPLVALAPETRARWLHGRTRVALNAHASPTAAFVTQPNWHNPAGTCQRLLEQGLGAEALGVIDAAALAQQLLGDALYANPLLLGYAWQRGWLPLERAALERAIELNGVAVAANRAAFTYGRWAAHEPERLQAGQARAPSSASSPASSTAPASPAALAAMLERRCTFLTAYQDAAYAERYRRWVERVQQAEALALGLEAGAADTRLPLTEAVAHSLFKLMAYKDEYEVARLHTQAEWLAQIEQQFEGPHGGRVRLHWHLAPPVLSGSATEGRGRKIAFGPWLLPLLRLLARGKRLRGTRWDPFGYSAERRQERALIADYQALLEELLANLQPQRLALAQQLAALPQDLKGYGHVKARHLAALRQRWGELLAQWRGANAV